MTWTYTAPTVDSRDEVRFLIQDTDSTDPQFSDEEIDYAMSAQGTGIVCALFLVRRLLAKYARLVDTRVGDVSESASQRVAQYQAAIADFESSLVAGALPTFGGVDVTAVQTAAADTSAMQPSFVRGQFDNPNFVGTSTDPASE